jgi:ribonuclease HI
MASSLRPTKLTVIVDASHDETRRVVGIGLVLHETNKPGRNGPVIDRRAEAYVDIPVGQMEKFAILRALEIARERGSEFVKVRSDYNAMRRRLKADHRSGIDHGSDDLHGRVLSLAKTFACTQLGYQPRRKNQAAHGLARFGAKNLAPASRPDVFQAAASQATA